MAWTYWQDCTATTPCDCTGDAIVTNPPQSCDDCLYIVSPTISCASSTPPCGVVGTLDLASLNSVTACTGTVSYTVLSYDTVSLTAVSIDGAGLLTWTTTNDAPINTFVEISYLVECSNSQLSGQGVVSLCIQSLCPTAPCAAGLECDPCTGNCVPIVPNITIE